MSERWACVHGENPACTLDDPCFDCADLAHELERAEGRCADDCRQCKFASVQLSPKVGQQTRGRKVAPLNTPKGNNSWERGLATDSRGVPLVGMDGHQITVKEYGEKRHQLEGERRRLANTPVQPTL